MRFQIILFVVTLNVIKTIQQKDRNWFQSNPNNRNFIANYLLGGCTTAACNYSVPNTHAELPGYDGWYNNLARPDSGAVDRPLLRRWPAAYEDGTYMPVTNRPNPLDLSEKLLQGDIGSSSRTGKNALLVFFGQQVVEEILDAQRAACPPEYFNIPIPEGHSYRNITKHTQLPLLRTRFDQRTGINPNNPRQQLNEITPYIDGGLMYGVTKQWADQLRTYSNGSIDPDGLLATSHGGLFPEYNTHRLPLANPPPPFHHKEFIKNHEILPVSRFFKLGNPRGNENTFLLTFGILWFRWHNYLARTIRANQPDWSSDKVFNEARKWTIATQQHIIMDEWLPSWINPSAIPSYKGYDASIDPQIDQFFQAAAFRFGHTLVTPGVYMRDYGRNGCGHDFKSILGTNAVRTCNAFWRPQDAIKANYTADEFMGIDRMLMGMAFQLCEEEDHKIVEDLRGNVFGPLEFPRRDLMAVNIQRGRDHGLPDFNTARKAYNLPPVTLENIHMHYPFVETSIITELLKLYNNSVDNIDPWVGGILETSDGPGPLFEAVIIDQFRRIRDADRFWYENRQNGLFSDDEIRRLKDITVYDIIMAVTQMDFNDIQKDVFRVPTEITNIAHIHSNCSLQLLEKDCSVRPVAPNSTFKCYHLPLLNAAALNESCVQGTSYDYFSNSEVSYILSFSFLVATIAGIFGMIYLLIRFKPKARQTASPQTGTRQMNNSRDLLYISRELINLKGLTRHILIQFNTIERQIVVFCNNQSKLRAIGAKSELTIFTVEDKILLIIKAQHDYSLILEFDTEGKRTEMNNDIKNFLNNIKCRFHEDKGTLKYAKNNNYVVTNEERKMQLERFFRVVFAQAFRKEFKDKETLSLEAKDAAIIANTEITLHEFADALNMPPDTSFVINYFKLTDADDNGFISFREFVDMLVIFAKGDAEDKAKLLFSIYDINKTGSLSKEAFTDMIRSFLEIVKGDIPEAELNRLINTMLSEANLNHPNSKLDFEAFKKSIIKDIDQLDQVNLEFKDNLTGTTERMKYIRKRAESIYGVTDFQGPKNNNPQEVKRNTIIGDDNDNNITETPEAAHTGYSFIAWIQKNSKEIFWIGLYTLVLLAVFAERAYYYSVEREHSGLRRIAGYGVTVTRGAASAMMFAYSSLLLTMCRNIITKLRDTITNKYFPFDSSVEIHKYISCWALFFTVLHIIGHAFNFYHISTQTADDLTCLFRNYFHATHELPKFHYWCWQTMTGFTGIVLTVLTALIFIFAQTVVRQRIYNWFWYTHSLYPVFFIFMILHGSGRLIQEPFFYYFFLGPVIIFTVDQIISISRRKIQINVLNAKILPSGVTMLEFERPDYFDYKSGQWVRIACLELNEHEYHPFTLSTSPDEETLTLHIRAVGPWTTHIRKVYEAALLESEKKLPPIYLDGPYGEGHQDWNKFEISILIGGGIGVTPFASILKDIVYRGNMKHGSKCKKVYFLWVSKTQKQFEWLVDLLRSIEGRDKNEIIETHIYITQFYAKFDIRTVMLYICEKHYQKSSNKSLFTNLEATTHFGRPKFEKFFKTVQNFYPDVAKIGVFSCGPPTMITQADQACFKLNKQSGNGPNFEHHYKTF